MSHALIATKDESEIALSYSELPRKGTEYQSILLDSFFC